MKRYVVQVTRTGHKEIEAECWASAEKIANNLNVCDGSVIWNDFASSVLVWGKDYKGKRWGDLLPEDRKFLLSAYSLTDIDAWEKGEHEEFTGNGMCFVDLNAECCYINGIVQYGIAN